MLDDIQAMAGFYATRTGRNAAAAINRRLAGFWPDLRNQRLLGLGYTAPFLPTWRRQVRHHVDAVTAHALANLRSSCIVQDDQLPFPDALFDRVLLVHAVETATDLTRMLRAVQRLLRDDGRLLLVVPNRTGLLAHGERTPFGDGAPFSVGRVERLLARSLFRIERLEGALFLPPGEGRVPVLAGSVAERLGRHVSPRLSGVLIAEAVKDIGGAVPLPVGSAVRSLRRRLLPVAARLPVPPPRTAPRTVPGAAAAADAVPDAVPGAA
ncbi:MAG: methyltransferase domain-containing protein [Gluconacetobacter diazotrophicus]|nr:methyltransferase domain-containing protein [Gluconacetobacter diazotrophicus]